MCYEMFYLSYEMFLRHLSRWSDRVLKVLNVPFVL